MASKWLERYQTLVDNEDLNTKQMQFILGWGWLRTREMRIELVAKLKNEGINLPDNKLIPTEIFLAHFGRDMKFYETKMMQEAKISKYRRLSND